mmetsp:Transcript_25922/g.54309  ORF Transcript_25922/g.54309 Transcript_25922/m.54309 type:complete len:256 (-) Transcript_25922:65-832(-)
MTECFGIVGAFCELAVAVLAIIAAVVGVLTHEDVVVVGLVEGAHAVGVQVVQRRAAVVGVLVVQEAALDGGVGRPSEAGQEVAGLRVRLLRMRMRMLLRGERARANVAATGRGKRDGFEGVGGRRVSERRQRSRRRRRFLFRNAGGGGLVLHQRGQTECRDQGAGRERRGVQVGRRRRVVVALASIAVAAQGGGRVGGAAAAVAELVGDQRGRRRCRCCGCSGRRIGVFIVVVVVVTGNEGIVAAHVDGAVWRTR